jgi:hypothetical protein
MDNNIIVRYLSGERAAVGDVIVVGRGDYGNIDSVSAPGSKEADEWSKKDGCVIYSLDSGACFVLAPDDINQEEILFLRRREGVSSDPVICLYRYQSGEVILPGDRILVGHAEKGKVVEFHLTEQTKRPGLGPTGRLIVRFGSKSRALDVTNGIVIEPVLLLDREGSNGRSSSIE